MKSVIILIVMMGIALVAAEDSLRNLLGVNAPRERGMYDDSLARLLLLPKCLCHNKRNSELINSLLGLPKNMNNAGK